MKIVVLKGGISSEREISLLSGDNIAKALEENGHNVICLDTVLPLEQIDHHIDPTPDLVENGESNLVKLLSCPDIQSADFIFNALHGGIGENGVVSGILEIMGYKFNGSGVEGCAIAMDKVVSKVLFEKYRIPTPKWRHFNRVEIIENGKIIEKILNAFDFPIVIKPAHEGSTVGLTIVSDGKELNPAIDKALEYNNELIVEKYIKGRELTVAILGNNALPIIEIIPKHGIYDYECKYTSGMSEYQVPAKIDNKLTQHIQELSIIAFKVLKCYGYGRADLRLGEDGIPYFLEMNTMPGMTALSLVPKAAKATGISFVDLLEKIIELGIKK
ncbi:MAG: D-alanine--D-alanine ligase [Candidatus Neomarinimicrobiota bacterium]|nr:MAG: D-alanine--D-alanine ligase [Candidatus Neomarinimicrobiota bacterium]